MNSDCGGISLLRCNYQTDDNGEREVSSSKVKNFQFWLRRCRLWRHRLMKASSSSIIFELLRSDMMVPRMEGPTHPRRRRFHIRPAHKRIRAADWCLIRWKVKSHHRFWLELPTCTTCFMPVSHHIVIDRRALWVKRCNAAKTKL